METTHESSKQTLRSAQPAKPYAFSRKVFCETFPYIHRNDLIGNKMEMVRCAAAMEHLAIFL